MMNFGGVCTTCWKTANLFIVEGACCFLICWLGSVRVMPTGELPTMVVPSAPSHLQSEANVLRTWLNLHGANQRQAECILGLLDVEYMLSIPLPPRTHRKPGTADYRWLRFLFRRHIQHILGWTTQCEESDPDGFGSDLNHIIRERLFPQPSNGVIAISC